MGWKNMAKCIAYLRVSTDRQELSNQELEIRRYAETDEIKIDEFRRIEISSRKSTSQRGIDQLLNDLDTGDTLIVAELSRLGRSISEIIRFVDELIKIKKVNIICIKDNIKIIDGDMGTDTKVKVVMFSLFAEIERDLISKRTKEALKAKKEMGVVLGRPKNSGKSRLDNYKDEIMQLLRNGSTKTAIAVKYDLTTPALYNWLKKHGLK